MRKSNQLLALIGFLAILMAAGVVIAAEKPPVIAAKPDIVINNVRIDRVSVTPAGHNVRISVTVMNTVPGTSTGPFKIKVEWTENPASGFNLLGTGGVANLVNDPSVIAVRGETRTFDQTVPDGKAYKYRVTADYMNQVAERDETNNVASAGYVAR